MKLIDLTGKRFGKLIVIKRAKQPTHVKRKRVYWLCECDCGNKKIIQSHNLVNGNTQSCGCLIYDHPRYNFEDLTGQKFERLLVIRKIERPKHIKSLKIYWLCRCDCGNEKIISAGSLKNKHSTSCGCYRKEIQSLPFGESNANKLFNNYKRHAENRNLSFELSKEEFLKLTKENCFYCGKNPSSVARGKRTNGNYIYNGIDRINPNEGYTTENTISCCGRCNEAKMSEKQEDFFKWIKTVHNNLSNKGLI